MLLLTWLLPLLVVGQTRGIDVSKYQGTINWTKVAKTKKVSFVYIKATEGASIQDPYYASNVKNARAAGLPVGSYHLYSSRTTAQQQFANFKSIVKKNQQDLIPVLDIEEKYSKDLNMERVDKILELMEKEYGCKPMIYTSESVYFNHFSKKKYEGYQFFIANYRRYPKANHTLWQYTQTGRISGISGYVDFSEMKQGKKVADIRMPSKKKKAKRTTMTTIEDKPITPTEKEEDKKTTDDGDNEERQEMDW
ncbi:MAG: GH25 family lysozyme [Bacteroidales bacterium]|nr:GH25 family lysozyme [Bacteroidales bacterium]